MLKKLFAAVLAVLLLCSCSPENPYTRYQTEFAGLFDTTTLIIGYTETKAEFEKYSAIIYKELERLNNLFDIYHDYKGINNLKTVNDLAGATPVKVDGDIISLLESAKQACEDTGGAVNPVLGPVLRIWHDYREDGLKDPKNAKLPSEPELRKASENADISCLIINRAEKTVFLEKPGMSLDAGATAKGYAAQRAVDAAVAAGMNSGLLNVGGNTVAVGKPLDGIRSRWGVGIQNPEETNGVFDTIYVNTLSVVTSGDYQRFYTVDERKYSHIIDPVTLTPAKRYASVTILHKDSAAADMLSTALFILPEDEGKKLLEKYGAECLWIYPSGESLATDGYKAVSKNLGGFSALD